MQRLNKTPSKPLNKPLKKLGAAVPLTLAAIIAAGGLVTLSVSTFKDAPNAHALHLRGYHRLGRELDLRPIYQAGDRLGADERGSARKSLKEQLFS